MSSGFIGLFCKYSGPDGYLLEKSIIDCLRISCMLELLTSCGVSSAIGTS